MIYEDIRDGTAVVTGASQGIGRATSIGLLNQKAKVMGIDLNEATIEHENYTHYCCDLQSTGEIKKVFNSIKAQVESIDYLVNVAGIDPKISIEKGDEKYWDKIVNLNLRGYYFCIRSSLDMLKKGNGKSIVNLSSINYRLGVPGRSIYSSTKAGIIGLTAGLARELGKEGIRINCISPGWIFTERQNKEYFDTGDEEKNKRHFEDLFSKQSLKVKIHPEDIANHVLFFLSDSSRATTGHNLVVDGGWLLE
ncbi:MAG: SDR family oxidoreductase [Ignavibacteria bacterium]|jgi:NAD(P)-dependent dehydrogenase (short-subunit alcohol dehydrogenase family)